MTDFSYLRLQVTVFTLVSAAFTNSYITQPVLPVLQQEFAADMVVVALTVSAVILGITCSNLPFGFLADRLPIQRIILVGGICVASGGVICALSHDLWTLIAARFLQGVFIPALTTCLAAFLAKTLPIDRLNVVMGSYVAASVIGGLGGRLWHLLLDLQIPSLPPERAAVPLFHRTDHLALRGLCDRRFHRADGGPAQQPVRQRQQPAGRGHRDRRLPWAFYGTIAPGHHRRAFDRLRRFFHGARRRGRQPQSQTGQRAGPGERSLNAVLLHRRMGGHHLHRFRL
jgi:hypothetical protein